MSQFVVIDTETTGLQPSDRILEFACVVIDSGGAIVRRVSTVVDPGRNPGPTRLHGVTQEMLCAAPSFGGIARCVFQLLNGRVVVAHNLAFDWMVLRKEFQRLGHRIPTSSGGLCTAELSRLAFGRRMSLRAACELTGIDLFEGHRGSGDAEATAQLLRALRLRLEVAPPHRPVVMGSRLATLPASKPFVPRSEALSGSSAKKPR